jgi:glycosyltransferase involved in cell wall biosynthesis
LFLETHVHRSVFPDANGGGGPLAAVGQRAYSGTLGRLVATLAERCYAISADAAEIASEYFGVPRSKLELCSLGVDTTQFHSPRGNEAIASVREEGRRALGVAPGDVVCVYTGRFTKEKDPLLLARAIALLQARRKPFRGLFIGDGEQADEIRGQPGCVVHRFVPARELPRFYWVSDIGVWPKQESTSQLDAAACGLPVIIGDRAEVRDRIDGNGAVYQEDSVDDLARVIESMGDPDVRARMGEAGARKMEKSYSWDAIARQRVEDYQRSMGGAAR